MAGPANLTYDSLVTDLTSYLERYTDTRFADQIPRVIMYAENRLAADLRILGTREVVSSTFSATNPVVAKPAYWRKTVNFNYTKSSGDRQTIFLRNYEFIREYWPHVTDTTGDIRYYADYDYDNFFLGGTPDAAYNFEILYIARLTPLNDAEQTNWFTANAPQVLLAACLYESEIWLKNQQRIALRQAAYTELRDALTKEDALRTLDDSIVLV